MANGIASAWQTGSQMHSNSMAPYPYPYRSLVPYVRTSTFRTPRKTRAGWFSQWKR